MRRAVSLLAVLTGITVLLSLTASQACAAEKKVKAARNTERLVILRDRGLFEISQERGAKRWKERRIVDFQAVGKGENLPVFGDISQPISLAQTYSSSEILLGQSGGGWGGFIKVFAWQTKRRKFVFHGEFTLKDTAEMGPLSLESWIPSENRGLMLISGEVDFPVPAAMRLMPKRKVLVGKKADRTFEQLQKKIRHKQGEGFFAAAYAPDGSVLAGADGTRLLVTNRRSYRTKTISTPVTYYSCMSISSDGRTLVWFGIVNRTAAYKEIEWYHEAKIDALGLIQLDTGKATVRRIRWIRPMPKGFAIVTDRIAVSKRKDALYFCLWKDANPSDGKWEMNLARYDIKRGTIEVIATDVTSFAVPY